MRQPCDGVGFAASGAMLDQIPLAGTVCSGIEDQFADDIELVIAGENDTFALVASAGEILFVFHFEMDIAADDLQPGILGQDLFPQIRCRIAVGVGRIPRRTPLAAFVEREEKGLLPFELRGHIDFVGTDREMDQTAAFKSQ